MKKIVYILLITVLIGCFSACDSNTQLPAFLERIEKMSNEELLAEFHIANAERVCNINASFLFETPLDLTTDTLFSFFVERMAAIDPDYVVRKKWHNPDDNNNLHIPISDIEQVLSTYLTEYNFNTEELEQFDGRYGYDPKSDMLITGTITGWGGYYTANILNRKLRDNVLTLEVEFYHDMMNPYVGVKTYTLLIEENGYKFLSVTQKEKQGNTLNDQIDYIKSFRDKELLNYLGIELLEMHTKGEFVFDNPLELSNSMLYSVFVERKYSDREIFPNLNDWLSSDNRYYYVPLQELKRVLSRYFLEFKFNTATFADYDSKKDLIARRSKTARVSFPADSSVRGKIINRNIEDSILTLEIEFYDTKEYTLFESVELYDAFDKFEFLYTRTYEILLEADGYKFLSVKEK